MALDPNIILQAGRGTPTTDLAMLLQQRSQIRLSQLAANRQSQTQSALDRVRADPSDMTSLADLAALDPQAANGYLGVQAAARAGRARTATADLYRSAVPDAQPAVPGAAPDAGSPAPPAAQPPVSGAPNQGAPASVDPFDHKGPAEQIVGSNVTSGKMTMQEAAAQLADVADPAQVQQVLGTLKSMDDLQFERVSRTNKMMADTLASIKASVPVDPNNPSQPARHAALMQNAPQLAALGITPQQIAQIDLSDQGINGVVGKAMGYQGLIEQAQKDRQFSLEAQKQNLEERKQTFEEHKPIAAGFGTTLVDPTTHQPVFDGSGGGSAASIPAIADRITAVEGTGKNPNSSASGPGQMVDGTFVSTFRQAFPQQAGLTDAQILAKRGTGVEGQMTQVLVAQNASQLAQAGISPTPGNVYLAHFLGPNGAIAALKADPSTPVKNIVSAAAVKANPMLASMTAQQVQNWANQKMGSGGAGGASRDAIKNDAEAYIAHGLQMAPGSSRNQAYVAAVKNEAAELMKERGITPGQAISGGQDLKSAQATLTEFTKGKSAATVRSLNVAVDHLDQLSEAAKALQNGNVKIFNTISQGYAKQTGSAIPTNFDAIKDFVTDEVTKAIIGAGGGVSDRESAASLISKSNSPQQLAGAIKNIQGLMGGQLNGLRLQYEQGTGRKDFERFVSPRAKQVLESHGSNLASIPEGAKSMLKGNPALRDQFDAKYGAGSAASVLGG